MSRAELIQKYENMMYDFGNYDVWDDDIQPNLEHYTTKEIKAMYEEDKAYYSFIETKEEV